MSRADRNRRKRERRRARKAEEAAAALLPKVIHLTARAIEWLRSDGDGLQYKQPVGQAACGAGEVARGEVCGVQDVRAMVRGYKLARHSVYRGNEYSHHEERPIMIPNCDTCLVGLDAGLTTTRQVHIDVLRELRFSEELQRSIARAKRKQAERAVRYEREPRATAP